MCKVLYQTDYCWLTSVFSLTFIDDQLVGYQMTHPHFMENRRPGLVSPDMTPAMSFQWGYPLKRLRKHGADHGNFKSKLLINHGSSQ